MGWYAPSLVSGRIDLSAGGGLLFALDRLEHAGHATGAMGDAPVSTERMYLVALQLGPFERGGVHDDPPAAIHLAGKLLAPFRHVTEKIAQHIDHVCVRVIVVIQQNDVVLLLGSLARFRALGRANLTINSGVADGGGGSRE